VAPKRQYFSSAMLMLAPATYASTMQVETEHMGSLATDSSPSAVRLSLEALFYWILVNLEGKPKGTDALVDVFSQPSFVATEAFECTQVPLDEGWQMPARKERPYCYYESF
jgi:hypothetical protein